MKHTIVIALLIAGFPLSEAWGQIPATAVVPENLPAAVRSDLNPARISIEASRALLRDRASDQNSRCKPAPDDAAAKQECRDRQQRFNDDVESFIWRVNAFNAEVEGNRIIVAMNDLAKRLQWTTAERKRLDEALNGLSADGSESKTVAGVNRVWKEMLDRGEALAAVAATGKGPGFPGAGQQTRFQDCAVFALANATGQPYGVVAARAAELMAQGDWRSPAERADPQHAIEKRGLIGGEVVMVAEALGQVEVVNSNDFVKTLDAGRAVMINVWPDGARGSHEVVLTKTFQHSGKTWFEVMDSNQGPVRRLYVDRPGLMMILKENGVAYSPEPGSTPRLLGGQ